MTPLEKLDVHLLANGCPSIIEGLEAAKRGDRDSIDWLFDDDELS